MKTLAFLVALLAAAPAFAQNPADAPATASPAPAEAPAKPDWMNFSNPYAGEKENIAVANRSNDEVSALATQKAGEALSFPMGRFNEQVKTLKSSFVQQGWLEYAAYLKEMNLLDVARSGKYEIATAADGDARVVGSGASVADGGAWRWEVNVPVITSVNQPDLKGEMQTVSSSRANVRIGLIRVAADAGGSENDGIAIAGWKNGAARK